MSSAASEGRIVERLTYVLITPARNEAAFIERTIRSVVHQTVLPRKWIIVSDGSTDDTEEIVRRYMATSPWIELVSVPPRAERHFAGKARAFAAGYAALGEVPYDILGNIDADISFDDDLMDFLLDKFTRNPRLGVAGAPFAELGKTYDFRFAATEHVSGACQLFRRACYEDIGGYVPVEGGGIDLIAVLSARMLGWETRTFPERHCVHHRPEGTAARSLVQARFRDGHKDYVLGAHPVWELFRAAYQMLQKPYLIRGSAILCGYLWASIRKVDRSVSGELMRFRRRDQMRRLKALFGKR
jgi:glycosyltransferase involved in cell wall biosynthesis